MTTQTLTPRQRLAKIVAEETDGGRNVVRFFKQVVEGRLDSDGFQAHHRMDAAKELVKIGLEEFEEYIESNAAPAKPRARKTPRSPQDEQPSPELAAARAELAQYARELTDGGRKMVRFYSDVMDGVKNDEGFKPHHRVGAAQKLITIGFGPDAELEYAPAPAPVLEARNAVSGHLEPDSPPWTMYHPPIENQESTGDVFREILSPDLMAAIESDDPIECPCMDEELDDDEYEECVGKENGCPYADREFPEFSEEDSRRIKESAKLGLRLRMEIICEQTNGRVPCPAHHSDPQYQHDP